MAGINLTQKEVEITDDGQTVGSFTQRDNSASYDLDVSTTSSVNGIPTFTLAFDGPYPTYIDESDVSSVFDAPDNIELPQETNGGPTVLNSFTLDNGVSWTVTLDGEFAHGSTLTDPNQSLTIKYSGNETVIEDGLGSDNAATWLSLSESVTIYPNTSIENPLSITLRMGSGDGVAIRNFTMTLEPNVVSSSDYTVYSVTQI